MPASRIDHRQDRHRGAPVRRGNEPGAGRRAALQAPRLIRADARAAARAGDGARAPAGRPAARRSRFAGLAGRLGHRVGVAVAGRGVGLLVGAAHDLGRLLAVGGRRGGLLGVGAARAGRAWRCRARRARARAEQAPACRAPAAAAAARAGAMRLRRGRRRGGLRAAAATPTLGRLTASPTSAIARGPCTGVPHDGQKRASLPCSAPQREHTEIPGSRSSVSGRRSSRACSSARSSPSTATSAWSLPSTSVVLTLEKRCWSKMRPPRSRKPSSRTRRR